ncbi:MAG: GFA family protein, partial [Luteibacter jiangsuensis]
MTTYKGSCHCGKVAYEVEIDKLEGVMECNCSMCSRKGAKMAFAPRAKLTLTTPESNAKSYLF